MKLFRLIIAAFIYATSASAFGQELFCDDFEGDLSQWIYSEDSIAQLHETEDPDHKTVLKLIPSRNSHCLLMKGSDAWMGFVMEGEILFPTNEHNYFGLVYGYQDHRERIDFGCIYIKGNGSYIRVNPHLDGNATRTLYEEFKTSLDGDETIHQNVWIPFTAEIIGSEVHLYVGKVARPQMIFRNYEHSGGLVGMKPRFAGGECWVDQISVKALEAFSYQASSLELGANNEVDDFVTSWQSLGPFEQRVSDVETSQSGDLIVYGENTFRWEPFYSDHRGCVLAGKVCRYTTREKYAYFSTEIPAQIQRTGRLEFSSVNNLHVWVNSVYAGSIGKQQYAWYDFLNNSEHNGKGLDVVFEEGTNKILVLVEGGQYGGDGFYMHVEKE